MPTQDKTHNLQNKRMVRIEILTWSAYAVSPEPPTLSLPLFSCLPTFFFFFDSTFIETKLQHLFKMHWLMKLSTAWHVGGGAVRKEQASILNALPFLLAVHLLPIQTNSFWQGSHTPSILSRKKKGKSLS
jgi:hypothetical protein